MRIIFATDHAGFKLKEVIMAYVRDELGYETEDCGALTYDEHDDYPQYMQEAAKKVAVDPENTKAIIFGGSGTGEAIVANRTEGVRAAVYYGGNTEILTLSREHNDANVLSLGARFLSEEEAKDAVKLWLQTPFSEEERHVRRNKQIDA
ncbi:RpiB/LacA/LacB family sugar-phosphate isomerase [Candidatus Kaiserbacteria bacterium]|nr:RpiB/LacA/LacB family sugar-phosphate isomerase [Candidatus Kaiserbacteria bacterium]